MSRRLRGGRSRTITANLSVPEGAAAGGYDLLGCIRALRRGRRITSCRDVGTVRVQAEENGSGGGGPGSGAPGGGNPAEPAPAPDTTAPTFAGLTKACPGGIVSSEGQPWTLEWSPASDNVTAQSAIVYDIYAASSSGAQDYGTPAATTAPGATSHSMTTHSTYFVVRARDAAGNRDSNTVERSSDSSCPLAP